MNTMQSDLAALSLPLEGFERRMADRFAASAEHLSAAYDRMATSRWWQTAVILGELAIYTSIMIAAIGWMMQFAFPSIVP